MSILAEAKRLLDSPDTKADEARYMRKRLAALRMERRRFLESPAALLLEDVEHRLLCSEQLAFSAVICYLRALEECIG